MVRALLSSLLFEVRHMITLGSRIGSYRIVRLLGEGGMGSVYEAVHDTINRRVALKVLHPQYARDPQLVKRFLNEARAANLVPHPAMVQISECGQAEDGTAFLVMEYLEGETLGSRLQRRGGRLSESMVASFAWQLATALAAAHERAIVHRDLKPGNVMLVQDPAMPAGERVKLLDFGIAKLGQDLARPDAVHTRTGVMMGTPLYMAPEQCLGFAQVDGKADVYSLGVMVFQMLAGKTPFADEVDLVLLNMHVSKQPPSLHKLAPAVSKSISRLVQQMLSKTASDRPAMKAVAQVLHAQAAAAIREPAPASLDTDETTVLPRASTTLHTGTGQLTVVPRRLSMVALLAGTGLVVVAFTAIWIRQQVSGSSTVTVQAAARPSSPPSSSAPPAFGARTGAPADSVTRKVRWHLSSQPRGATVVNVAGNVLLGITPWTQERSAQSGYLKLALTLKGYHAKTVLLNLDEDVEQTESLVKDQPLSRRSSQRAPATTRKPGRAAGRPPARNTRNEQNDVSVQRIID